MLDIHSDWPNASEAYCAAWDLAETNGHAEPRPQTFVYVGIEVPEPEGYQVTFHHPGDDRRPHEGYGPAWYFETDSCGSEDYSSELDARIAAWRDLFAKQDKESSTKNVILPVIFEGEYCADVTHVSVAISVQDYHRWSELHKVGKENKVASLTLYDSPNKFLNLLDDTVDLSSLPDSDTESSFRPEAGRLEICIATETVKFVGYEKHVGPESIWLTEEIKLSELAGNFGLKR
ncbi:hypothetical protein ACT3UJ_06385 [Halomonas sp. 86]|uniref:hypothetical protein n=1 Tax=unclassified Halomonas TaxID=2609666 RepID=UPI0040339579